MTNVPRAELRNMDGGRCRVNSIRGGPRRLLRISRDVNLRTYPTRLNFPRRPLFSRTMDTPINCIDALKLAVPSFVSSLLLSFYLFLSLRCPLSFFLSFRYCAAASHKSNYTLSEIRFLFGHARIHEQRIRRG